MEAKSAKPGPEPAQEKEGVIMVAADQATEDPANSVQGQRQPTAPKRGASKITTSRQGQGQLVARKREARGSEAGSSGSGGSEAGKSEAGRAKAGETEDQRSEAGRTAGEGIAEAGRLPAGRPEAGKAQVGGANVGKPKTGGFRTDSPKGAKGAKASPRVLDTRNMTEAEIEKDILRSLQSAGIFDELRRECTSTVTSKAASKKLESTVGALVDKLLSKEKWDPSTKYTARAKLRRSLNARHLEKAVSQLVDESIAERKADIRKLIERVYYGRLGLPVPRESSDSDSSSDDSDVDEATMQAWTAEYNQKYGFGRGGAASSRYYDPRWADYQPNAPGSVQQGMNQSASSSHYHHGWYGMAPGMSHAHASMEPQGMSSSVAGGQFPGYSHHDGAQPYSSAHMNGAWAYPHPYQYYSASSYYPEEGKQRSQPRLPTRQPLLPTPQAFPPPTPSPASPPPPPSPESPPPPPPSPESPPSPPPSPESPPSPPPSPESPPPPPPSPESPPPPPPSPESPPPPPEETPPQSPIRLDEIPLPPAPHSTPYMPPLVFQKRRVLLPTPESPSKPLAGLPFFFYLPPPPPPPPQGKEVPVPQLIADQASSMAPSTPTQLLMPFAEIRNTSPAKLVANAIVSPSSPRPPAVELATSFPVVSREPVKLATPELLMAREPTSPPPAGQEYLPDKSPPLLSLPEKPLSAGSEQVVSLELLKQSPGSPVTTKTPSAEHGKSGFEQFVGLKAAPASPGLSPKAKNQAMSPTGRFPVVFPAQAPTMTEELNTVQLSGEATGRKRSPDLHQPLSGQEDHAQLLEGSAAALTPPRPPGTQEPTIGTVSAQMAEKEQLPAYPGIKSAEVPAFAGQGIQRSNDPLDSPGDGSPQRPSAGGLSSQGDGTHNDGGGGEQFHL